MINEVQVGQRIPDLMHNSQSIPVEARVDLHRDHYRHEYPMVWRHTNARATLDGYYLSHPLTLGELPGGAKSFELPAISEAEWKWRIRDSALAAAERSGVNTNTVITMCKQFGAGEARLFPGQVVSNSRDLELLPIGSVVYSAHPDAIDAFKVWRQSDNLGLRPLLGTTETREHGYPVVIHSIPETNGGLVLPVEEAPATVEQLAQISLRAWRVGKVFKQRQSWCSVFENTLTVLGIDENTAKLVHETFYGPGDELDREQASSLPEGSLLWWNWRNRSGAAVYVRDDRARNKSRTRRVWGWNDSLENSHDHMIVVKTPEEDIAWRVNGSALRHMPDGTVFGYEGQSRTLDASLRPGLAPYLEYTVTSWPVTE